MLLGARGLMMGDAEPYKGLTFTSLQNGSTVSLVKGSGAPTCHLSYSMNNGMSWKPFTGSSPTITLDKGRSVCFKATTGYVNNAFGVAGDYTKSNCFSVVGMVEASGSVMSLIREDIPEEFPDTTGQRAFNYLFYNSPGLLSAPLLPASKLLPDCYYGMFCNCTALVSAPALPATTLASNCYANMFTGCTSLVNAPALPATTLETYCYWHMFNGCTSLVNAPALPAKAAAYMCYGNMFYKCTSLVNAPALPATTLETYCYNNMFALCSSLTSVPSLPGTEVKPNSYTRMFYGCTSLVNAPEIQATVISGNSGCSEMFSGCTSLVNVPALQATTLATSCYAYMFKGCTSLVNAPALPAINLADSCYNQMFSDCTSLVNAPALPATTLASSCYEYMFSGCTSLVNAPALPATNLGQYCYEYMFYNCTSLVNAPALQAATLTSYCYYNMFNGCTSLVNAPALPSTSIRQGCYSDMFSGCTSLVNAPALPATTISYPYSYRSMFSGCTSLVNAPALPATTLETYCYEYMFYNCTSLVNAPALPATTLKGYCYDYMFKGCTSLVNAPALPATTLANYCYRSMFSGCTSLVNAPNIYLASLATNCYQNMFTGCSSLSNIFVESPIKEEYRTSWMDGVSPSGCYKYYEDGTREDYGIPSGWTFEKAKDELVPLEYIESDGVGKIDTGVKFGDGVTGLKDIGFEMEVVACLCEDAPLASLRVMGFGTTVLAGYYFRYYYSGTTHTMASYATATATWSLTDQDAMKKPATIKMVKAAGDSVTYFYVDGIGYGSKSTTVTTQMHDGVNAELFGWQYQTAASTAAAPSQAAGGKGFRIYSARIKNTVTGQEVEAIPMLSNLWGAVMVDVNTGVALNKNPRGSLIPGPKKAPYDYEVEWLQSDGASCVDIPVSATVNVPKVDVENLSVDFDIIRPSGSGLQYILSSYPLTLARVAITANTGTSTTLATCSTAAKNITYTGVEGTDIVEGVQFKSYTDEENVYMEYYKDGVLEKQSTVLRGTASATTYNVDRVTLLGYYNPNNIPPKYMPQFATHSRLKSFILKSSSLGIDVDLMPVVKDGVGYFYDRVSGQLFGNSVKDAEGKDLGALIPGPRKEEKPYDYELEWLQGDGTAYVDTGITVLPAGSKPTEALAEIDVLSYKNDSALSGIPVGIQHNVNNGVRLIQNTNGLNYAFFVGLTTATDADKARLVAVKDASGTTYSINDGPSSFVPVTSTSTRTVDHKLVLFAVVTPSTGAISASAGYRMGRLKYKQLNFGMKEIDLIPVEKDGIGYFYDKISGELLGNSAASGALILGPRK